MSASRTPAGRARGRACPDHRSALRPFCLTTPQLQRGARRMAFPALPLTDSVHRHIHEGREYDLTGTLAHGDDFVRRHRPDLARFGLRPTLDLIGFIIVHLHQFVVLMALN